MEKIKNDKDIKLPLPVFWLMGIVAISLALPFMVWGWADDPEKVKGFF